MADIDEILSSDLLTYPIDLMNASSYFLIIPKDWSVENKATPDNPRSALRTKLGNSIALYMPDDISVEHNIGWSSEETGVATDIKKALSGSENSEEFKQQMGGSLGERATTRLSKMVDEVTGTKGGALALREKGQAINPHLKMFFESLDFRTFDFNFTFAPKNSDEVTQVNKIRRTMEKSALPGQKISGGTVLEYPSYFWLYMKTLNHETNQYESIISFKPSVVTSLSFNLTPESVWAQFRNGEPVQLTMNVSFSETELYTRDMVK